MDTEQLEAFLIEALNGAITAGHLLVNGEYGVRWDAEQGLWVWDPEASPVPSCDVLGAVLLSQPALDPQVHRGDPDRAIRALLDVSLYENEPDLETLFGSDAYAIARGIANGWDSEEYFADGAAAYAIGAKLAEIYRPLPIDIVVSTESEIRIKVPMDLDSFPDIETHALVG